MWKSSEIVSDEELVGAFSNMELEKYCPEVEDISMDDDTLCSAVECIET